MALDQLQTFNWMRDRIYDELEPEIQRLREENQGLREKLLAATLQLAQLRVKPLVDKEREGENVTSEIMSMRMRAASRRS